MENPGQDDLVDVTPEVVKPSEALQRDDAASGPLVQTPNPEPDANSANPKDDSIGRNDDESFQAYAHRLSKCLWPYAGNCIMNEIDRLSGKWGDDMKKAENENPF
ncbi:hypothetical protein [Mesorhizobium sp. M0207]|uniref:hypothetical protein n=1 Tax=Mesorhizobium sp. M0207 TaxID=2956915 RepID=UPI003337F677